MTTFLRFVLAIIFLPCALAACLCQLAALAFSVPYRIIGIWPDDPHQVRYPYVRR